MNGLNKELRLAIHPTTIIFLAFGFMLLIPNYPYLICFFYCTLGLFFTCLSGRENRDIFYSMLLPIRKKDIVKARMQLVCLIETLQVLICIPFMYIRCTISDVGNEVGMDANYATLGFGFLLFAIFNYVFMGIYYKNVDKVGKAFAIGSTFTFVYIMVIEVCAHVVPFFKDKLDVSVNKNVGYQLVVFAICCVIYVLVNLVTYKKAVKSFEVLDL